MVTTYVDWYRGPPGQARYLPSLPALRSAGALDTFVLQGWVRSSRYEAQVVTRKRAVVQLQAGIRRRAVIRAVQLRKDSALEQMRATVRARPISAAAPPTPTSASSPPGSCPASEGC